MEHQVFPKGRDGSPAAHKFYKEELIRVEEGDMKGSIMGMQIVAKIEVGGGPKQVTVEQLEKLLADGKPIVMMNREETRMDVDIHLGGDRGWTEAEIQEIIDTVRPKPKRGRPPKDAKSTDSGARPADAGEAGE